MPKPPKQSQELNPWETDLKENLSKLIHSQRKEGTTSMSLPNILQILPIPANFPRPTANPNWLLKSTLEKVANHLKPNEKAFILP